MIPRNRMKPHPDVMTPRHLARLQRRAVRALRAGRDCRLRLQTLLALCARLTQAEAQLTEVDDTYHRLVEEHDAGMEDWVRLLEVLGINTWSSWSTISATVVARVEALVTGVRTGDDATQEGGA